MEDNIESSNIHFKWLDNIYNQLDRLQDMERIAREGCNSLMEYLQIPPEARGVVIGDLQYKNLKFIVDEISILIDNLAPVLKEEANKYKDTIFLISKSIDRRELFLKDVKSSNQIIRIETKPFFNVTLNYLIKIKSELIIKIAPLLYIESEVKKKW